MNQRNLTKYVVAFLIFFMATSCSKENSSNLPVTENFKALVMGGKDIDPNQTWSTASNIPVTISVDFLSGSKYTIYIYQSHPASDNNITYLGMTTIVSGESKTIYVAKPADVSQLFAACYDSLVVKFQPLQPCQPLLRATIGVYPRKVCQISRNILQVH